MQKKRTACVGCGAPLQDDVVLIGDQYPSAIFITSGQPLPPELTATSLNVTRCANNDCRLVQLSHEYNLQYVFDHYPYESGITATMAGILQDLLDDALRIVSLKSTDVVLDIGGNDGTMLNLIKKPVGRRVNIDAAAGVTQCCRDEDYIHVHAKFTADVYKRLGLSKPKLITSVAMFYHLNNPQEFCEHVKEVMDHDSVWVLQMTYLGTMLRDNIFDNIVHEHVAYYSLASLEAMLKRVGLHIAEARIVESYGGSLRVYIVKEPAAFPREAWRVDYPSIQKFESEHRTNTFEELYAFNSRTQLLRSSLRSLIEHLVREHGPIAGFGASTKGNMILQLLGLDTSSISCLLDNSTKKIGTFTTGTLIPIVDEAAALKDPPPYMIVLPYYYTKAFIRIIKRQLPRGRKVNLLVPLPHPYFIQIIGG